MDGISVCGEPSAPPSAVPLGKSRAELLNKLRGCPPAVALPLWLLGLLLRWPLYAAPDVLRAEYPDAFPLLPVFPLEEADRTERFRRCN